MARRASSKLHPIAILVVVILVAGIIIAGKSLVGKKSAAFGEITPLDVRELLENGNSLRGNEYVIEGQIDEKLRWTPDRGQIVSVIVNSNGEKDLIGIEIPAEFNHLNIDSRQKYVFRVKFRQGGIPVATGINRL
jgi:hypothetical protein